MKTPNYRKKLIEVALPLEAISEESSRRKRKSPAGYPTTFHKWWAQRPLAACRAVLFASLVDDPDSDPAYWKPDGSVDEDRAGVKRAELFNLIEELVKWENSKNEKIINAARAEIARCIASRKIELGEFDKATVVHGPDKGKVHPKGPIPSDGRKTTAWEVLLMRAKPDVVNGFLTEYAPPVLDPFAGGGSIPLEAQRLGLRVYASDLNPVPVLINKALIEIPSKFAGRSPVNPDANARLKDGWKGAQGLTEDIRYYGRWMRGEAEARIGHLYPKVSITLEMAEGRPDLKPYVGQDLPVVAWLWARTVVSTDPAVSGAHVPLVGSYWLSTKPGKQAWVQPLVDRSNNAFSFKVGTGDPPPGLDPRKGTVTRTGATCLISGSHIPFEHIRSEGKAGRIGHRLMAIVVEGRSRMYVAPLERHAAAAQVPLPTWFPDTPIPPQALGFRVQLYGMDRHYKLFTNRQLVAMETLIALLRDVHGQVVADGIKSGGVDDGITLDAGGTGLSAYANAITTYLAAALSRVVDYNSAVATWRPKDNAMRSTFSKQAMPMVWDFAEGNIFAESSAGFDECVTVVARAMEYVPGEGSADVRQLDAAAAMILAGSPMTCTDPPYYSNIGYADLSDYFYVWLRHALGPVFPSLFATVLTPKTTELIATPHRHEGGMEAAKAFFEAGLRSAFCSIKKIARPEYPTTVFYAFKQTESEGEDNSEGAEGTASTGWETMISAFTGAGFVITGTWPMRTEGDNRSVGIGANALASSVVLVGIPRSEDAPLATRREFLNALKKELPSSLRHLQRGNIAPVDLAQAAIGPGMSVFTRYAKVMEADGSPMTVRQALTLINQALDEVLAEQEGEFDSDTRWALAWFEQFGMDDGPYGVAETLSKAKNSAVNALVEAGIVRAHGGKVRLLKRDELPADWNPVTDNKVRHWEVTQHLIRAMETGGETSAADLLRRVGGMGEMARDLAYRLYNLCERKKWAQEAISYNGLVIAWPEISKLAQSAKAAVKRETQNEMFKEGQ